MTFSFYRIDISVTRVKSLKFYIRILPVFLQEKSKDNSIKVRKRKKLKARYAGSIVNILLLKNFLFSRGKHRKPAVQLLLPAVF